MKLNENDLKKFFLLKEYNKRFLNWIFIFFMWNIFWIFIMVILYFVIPTHYLIPIAVGFIVAPSFYLINLLFSINRSFIKEYYFNKWENIIVHSKEEQLLDQRKKIFRKNGYFMNKKLIYFINKNISNVTSKG